MIRRLRVLPLIETLLILWLTNGYWRDGWFDPWQDYFNYFINSMYKWHFNKPNIELRKTHLSAFSSICNLHIQVSNIHMRIVPGPALQVAVINRVYASPGLHWRRKIWVGKVVSRLGHPNNLQNKISRFSLLSESFSFRS
jgi:hypothetical protein